MKSKATLSMVLVALMAFPLLAFSTQPIYSAHPMVPAPPNPEVPALAKKSGCYLPTAQCLASINWSGYAVTNTTDATYEPVTFVGASWTVPRIAGAVGTRCPDTVNTWLDASFWVGIDGFNNNYVEQTGTSVDCVYGQAQYYPWYEFYPALSYSLPSADLIYPGDVMYAYVNYTTTTQNFGIWLQDKTFRHTWHFSLIGANTGAPADSAEWITEAAYGCISADCSVGNFLALTDFTAVTFTGATATIGRITAPVSSAAWSSTLNWIEVTTVFYPPPGPFLRAYPTTPTKTGNFDVEWVSSGP